MGALDALGGRSKVASTLLGLALIVLIGFLDYATGYEISLSFFYLLPVALVSWGAGRGFGAASSVLSAGFWLAANVGAGNPYPHGVVIYWNAVTRLGVFLLVSLLISELKGALDHLQELSRTDSLTGAASSRHFREHLHAEIERSHRYKRYFTLVYVDVDNFKAVNDTYGHSVGDRLLQTVVEAMGTSLRKTDIIARLGGDEFALLLPECGEEEAHSVVRKARSRLAEHMKANGWPVTVSIGALTCRGNDSSTDELMKIVDGLMYSAKTHGKDAVRYSSVDGYRNGSASLPPK